MSVTQIRLGAPADEIPETLRRLADQIEAGEIEDMPVVTTAVVCLGHTSHAVQADGSVSRRAEHALYGCGPRADLFTIRGLLLTVATRI